MTVRNRTELETELNNLFPDNTTQEISPADLRAVVDDIVDSALNVHGLGEGEVPAYMGTTAITAEPSGLKMIRSGGNLLSPSNFMAETEGLSLADIARLFAIGSLVNVRNNATGQTFELVDHRADRDAASSPPSWFDYQATEASVTQINANGPALFDLSASGGVSFNWMPTYTGRVWAMEFEVSVAAQNVRVRVLDTDSGIAVLHYPSIAAWEAGTGGVDMPTGAQQLNFTNSPLFSAITRNHTIEIRADSGTLSGTGSNPAFGIVRQVGSRIVLQNRGADFYLGTLGGASADHQTWPAANRGEYVIATANISVDGTDVSQNQHYRCTTDGSTAGDGSNWVRVTFPSGITLDDVTDQHYNRYLGTLGQTSGSGTYTAFPAAVRNDIVQAVGSNPGTVNGLVLVPDAMYRCIVDSTPGANNAHWEQIPIATQDLEGPLLADDSGSFVNTSGFLVPLASTSIKARIVLTNINLSQSAGLWVRFRRTGQANVDSAANNYAWTRIQQNTTTAAAPGGANSNTANRIDITSNNILAGNGFNAEFQIYGVNTASRTTLSTNTFFQASGTRVSATANGTLIAVGPVDRIQIAVSAGTFTGGYALFEERT